MTGAVDRLGIALHTHGYGGYTRGCRCEICTQAKADYMRGRRASARALAARFTDDRGAHFVPDVKHGRVGYEERGCRCPVCVEARRASQRVAVEGGDTP